MKPVFVRPAACSDIDDAAAYLLSDGQTAGLRFLDAIEAEIRRIGDHPGIGSPRWSHLLPMDGLRVRPVRGFPHLVLYFDFPDRIDVLRVVHGARDLAALMAKGPLDSED